MKKTYMLGGFAALTLAAAGGVALAQQAPAASPQRHARADTNADGRISQAEFVQQRVQRLTASDANRDGTVTVEERQAAMQAHRAERNGARFARLDSDSNGSISRSEFDGAHAARGEGARDGARGDRSRGHRGGRQANRGGDMAHQGGRHGADRGPVVIAEAQAKATEAFARLDANSDGYVTAEEGRAGRQQMREQRRERMGERRANRQASPAPSASE
ncbi:EF-hand domain-containing protein [uncultured Brevundimonas sp.]|uniref:EF-hand domain-containing protein n=1 Tax=uncultured Brevundimonas sp. TaxID=213418 RepID=UPI0030ED9871|tara:strand:- start:39608 stop:40261 length:654 start_codon:yes stop_codon:yes gene_type:complete